MPGSTSLAKAVYVATALAACLGAAGQHPDWHSTGADDLGWTFDQESSDLRPDPEQDDACSGGAPACDLSLRQLRGELRRDAPQQLGPAELEEEQQQREARASGSQGLPDEGGNMEGHLHHGPDDDYRRDAEVFLQQRAGKSACRLPRASFAKAKSVGARVLDEYIQAGGAMKEEPTDNLPWPVRARWAEAMFDGKPGLLEGVGTTWPATTFWANSSALAARLGPRRMRLKSFFFGPDAPVPSNKLPEEMDHRPPPETMREYLERNESGRNFIIFVSETIETSDFNLALLQDLKPDIEPLPFFAAPAYQRQAIVALDGLGASAGWHHHAAVWQTQVTGRKAWWLMPPAVAELFTHGPPLVNGQVFDHRNACELLSRQPPPPGAELCVLEPGETLILPKDWWHATCGLDDITASAGGWMHE